MTLGVDCFGTVPFGYVENPGAVNPLRQAWDADSGRVFLYEVTAYNRAFGGAWNAPLGTLAFGDYPPGVTITGEVTFRYSDTGFLSGTSDSVANTNFDASISSGLKVTATLPPTPEASRRVTLNLATFDIANPDGALDSAVRGYTVDGRLVRVLVGLSDYRYDNFTPIFTGRLLQWSNDTSDVTIEARDQGYRLDKPMQTDIYTGAGGYGGGSDVGGKPRPLCFGKVLNISPILIDSANLVYQFHSRECSAVDAVYDRGAALTADADYASYALLVAASITTGHFATCLALGLIRLGSTPSGLITADVRGDAHGGYSDVTGVLAVRFIKDFGGLADTDLDLASWANFQALVSGTIGWFQDANAINVSDAINQIMGGCAAWWGAAPNGLFQAGQLAPPENDDTFVLDIQASDIIGFKILQPLNGTFPPRFRQRVGYQKLWTTQADQDLAGAVTAARRQYLSQDSRIASSQDLTVQTAFLLATDPDPLISLFYNQADATALATSLLSLLKAFRQPVQVTLDLMGLAARLGANAQVTYPRLNSGNATRMRILDIEIDADAREVTLTLWG